MKYYKLKDACSVYQYVFEESENSKLKYHSIDVEMLDYEDEELILKEHSYNGNMNETMELDYLGYSEITKEEYFKGIIDEYISDLIYDRAKIKHDIKLLKEYKKLKYKKGE